MNLIKVVIADADEESRSSLQELLAAEADIQVAAVTGEGSKVIGLLRETGADVLVTDLVLYGMDGLDLLQQILEEEGYHTHAEHIAQR